MEVRDRILKAAEQLFYAYGLKSVTMDDVSRHLGMSKKTLYHHFTDKDHLLHTLLKSGLEEDRCEMEDISSKSNDAVHEIIMIMKHVGDLFSSINPNLFYDMQKYHPQAWKVFLEFRDNCLMQMVERNLENGMTQGLYRKNLDARILARMRMQQVEMGMDPRLFPPDKFNLSKVQLHMLEHFLFGIATLKGHKLINKYLQITEDE